MKNIFREEEIEKHRKIYKRVIKKVKPGDYLKFTSKTNKENSFIFLIVDFLNFTEENIYSNVYCYTIGTNYPGLYKYSCYNIEEWINQSAGGYVCELVREKKRKF